MGIMADDQKNNIIVELEKIAANFQAIPLEFKEFRDYSLEFVNSIELQKLHEAVTTMIDPFLTHEVAPEMYNETQGTELDPSIFSWVEHFQDRHSFKNFQPHITIGQSSDTAVVIPTYSTASTLALCHLGNFNTCRTILWSTKLINHSL
jgi:2'-5' RNA ligase